jgi:hypothetical protein
MHDSRKLLIGLLLTLGFPAAVLAQAPPGSQMPRSNLEVVDQALYDARAAALNLNDVNRE